MMKKFLARYKVFLALVVVNIIIGIVIPKVGMSSINITIENLLGMLSIIPPIFILLGLLDVWVDRATMMKYTGKGSGVKGVLIAFLIGSAAAGPLYASFPVAAVMLKKGSSLFNVFIFIGAWSTTKIPMLTFEAANLGFKFTLVRLALSIIGILLIAAISEKLLNEERKKEIYELNQS